MSADVSFWLPLHDGATHAAAVAYLALCCFGAVLIIASCATQCAKPAPYGKFAEKKDAPLPAPRAATSDELHGVAPSQAAYDAQRDGAQAGSDKGPIMINQRVAHILSDFPAGVVLITVLYAAVPHGRRTAPSIVLLLLWLAHYVHRGLLHPLLMRYSDKGTPLGICLGGMLPNCTFASAVALHLAFTDYPSPLYFYDPRFLIGCVVFVIGYVINRWADFRMRALRAATPRGTYAVPRGGLFEVVCCPNYFGEFVEWAGFAIATSSLVGVLWAFFGLSTFLPRALATQRWYRATFAEAELPPGRWAALFPFVL